MADGFLLDAYPDPARREIVAWLKPASGGAAIRLAEPFTPVVYARAGSTVELDDLATALTPLAGVGRTEVTEAVCGLDAAPSPVLRVPVTDYRLVQRVAQMIDARGAHKDFEVFDADLRMTHRWFQAKRLWPLAKVRAWTAGRYRLLEESKWALEYETPPLRRLEVGADADAPPGKVADLDSRVARAWVREPGSARRRVFEGPERDVLEALHDAVADADPDVVLTRGGDAFLLPFLHARAARYDALTFHLGREPDPVHPRRRGKSYFTYGRIKYQAPAFTLHGRLHIDRASSFFYAEAGLTGILDLARVSRVPVQDLARLGAGTALTAIQIDLAKSEGRLVPWKKNVPERFKTARDLLLADRGGYIYEPQVGLHEDVVEFDFASLYPNVMVNHNISPETILCDCCTPADLPFERVVPQLGTWTCGRRTGFIPTYLKPVIERREHFKRKRKTDPANAARYQEVCDVYKWLLVTSFGYQGYRNAKFGRIECHEAIGAWGRETLLTASEIARDHGFEVVHGIVDSLWVKRVVPGSALPARDSDGSSGSVLSADPRRFEQEVDAAIGVPFEYEGRYKWIVFLPTREWPATKDMPAVGALNRYYGCFDAPPGKPNRSQAGQPVDYLADGALKVRGVEMRQHSTPPVMREAQERFLVTVAEAENASQFMDRLPRAIEAARPVLDRVLDGACALDELVFNAAVSKGADDYRVVTAASAAVKQLARRGVHVPPGDTVHYVILNEASRDPEGKVVEARLIRGDEAYDRDAYARFVLRALASLTLPFGYDEDALARWFGTERQLTLSAFA